MKAIVRSPDKIPTELKEKPNLTIVEGTLLDMSKEEVKQHIEGCTTLVSCLGHVLSFKGRSCVVCGVWGVECEVYGVCGVSCGGCGVCGVGCVRCVVWGV